MTIKIEGHFDGSGKKFALVLGRFNELITQKLQGGAIDSLVRHGVNADHITEAWVPGAFEIPLAAKKMAASGS